MKLDNKDVAIGYLKAMMSNTTVRKRPDKAPPPKRDFSKVYFITSGDVVKIGGSNYPESRLEQLQTGSPRPLRLACVIPGNHALESSLHRRFSQYRLNGEWFELSDEIRAYIRENGGRA